MSRKGRARNLNPGAKSLAEKGFFSAYKTGEREAILGQYSETEDQNQKKFYELIRANTIFGFTTAREVMVNHLGYQVAPGFYNGCVEVPAEKA